MQLESNKKDKNGEALHTKHVTKSFLSAGRIEVTFSSNTDNGEVEVNRDAKGGGKRGSNTDEDMVAEKEDMEENGEQEDAGEGDGIDKDDNGLLLNLRLAAKAGLKGGVGVATKLLGRVKMRHLYSHGLL